MSYIGDCFSLQTIKQNQNKPRQRTKSSNNNNENWDTVFFIRMEIGTVKCETEWRLH